VRTIREWIEQLAGQGFLQKWGDFNVLQVSPEGRRVLKGELTPRLLQPADDEPTRARSRSRSVDAESWEGVDSDLFETLRQVRRTRAAEQGVPPYVIFSDATLRDMARLKPPTLEHLHLIKGVGEKKAADFGELFLEVIQDHLDRQSRRGDREVAFAPTIQQSGFSRRSDKGRAVLESAFALFRQGARVEQVAANLSRAVSTTRTYLDAYIRAEGIADPTPWVDAEIVRRIETAVDEAEGRSLKTIYDRLDGKCQYDDIRIVLACRAQREAT